MKNGIRDGRATMEENEEIRKGFYENPKLYAKPKESIVGSMVSYEDPNLMNDDMTDYAVIPCMVVYVNTSQFNPGVKYYYLKAVGSKNDEDLNTMIDPTIGSLQFYKIVGWDDPHLREMKIVEEEGL